MKNILLENDIIENVLSCEFDKAEALINYISYDELENLLLKIGYDYGQSMCIYAFICYLITRKDDIEYHFIAEAILCGPLCYIEGAYNTALYHNKKILIRDKENIKAMAMMLFYNTLPTPLVCSCEAKEYAKKILMKDPYNETATQFLM